MRGPVLPLYLQERAVSRASRLRSMTPSAYRQGFFCRGCAERASAIDDERGTNAVKSGEPAGAGQVGHGLGGGSVAWSSFEGHVSRRESRALDIHLSVPAAWAPFARPCLTVRRFARPQ